MQHHQMGSVRHTSLLFLFLSLLYIVERGQGSTNPPSSPWYGRLSGIVDDCCCEVSAVDHSLHDEHMHEHLSKLVNTTFFRYFKVNFQKECPFWDEDYVCSIDGPGLCGVCEVPEDQIPVPWRESRIQPSHDGKDINWEDDDKDIWIIQDDQDKDTLYVDLPENPERYTGYTGGNPAKIWMTIYQENCFPDPYECVEQRVFYRLISGLHASTTAHIFENHFDTTTKTWRPNVPLFTERLGNFPDRLKNIYFTFLFLLRATHKASSFLSHYNYNTGHPQEDASARTLVQEVLQANLCSASTFDETPLFKGERAALKRDFMHKFRNISQIMDCVACQTCKVHAKLQILGIATALKILLADERQIEHLQRNEVIALLNTLHKFSESIQIIHDMKLRSMPPRSVSPYVIAATIILTIIVTAMFSLSRHRPPSGQVKTPASSKTQPSTQGSAKKRSKQTNK